MRTKSIQIRRIKNVVRVVVTVIGLATTMNRVEAAPVASMTVDEVTYLNNHPIYRDTGTQAAYPTPHWKRGRTEGGQPLQSPVCYTRNTPAKVSAKFIVTPSNAGQTVKIKGVAGSYIFGPQDVTPSSGIATFSATSANSNLPDAIRPGTSPFNIAWYFSKDGGANWILAGTSTSDASSSNTVYVTMGTPAVSKLFHTVVDISCKKGSEINPQGPPVLTDQQYKDAVVEKIWTEFSDRSVKRVGSATAMTYYGNINIQNYYVADLLKYGDGQCGAWADFFLNTIKAQGIDYTNEYVYLKPLTADGFIVKNWNFAAGAGTSGVADYPYLNLPKSPDISSNAYQWKFAEVTDATGIEGQGPTANPASRFNNHQQIFIAINGTYYDPSYGKTFTSLPQIDDEAMDGYYLRRLRNVNEPDVNLDLNGDGDKLDLNVSAEAYNFQKNAASLDLKVEPEDH